VSGNFTQGANGILVVENGGWFPSQYDQLIVGGTANLGGKLDIENIHGYTPGPQDTFSPLMFTSATGAFSSVTSNAQISVGANGLIVGDDSSKPNPVLGQPKNISTRAQVLQNDGVMIGGFILSGSTPKTVVLRAIGPSLAQYGVKGTLDDTVLLLYDKNGKVTSNDNWKIDDDTGQSQAANVPANFQPQSDNESVIVRTLQPNQSYTCIVTGKGSATGVALVEAYDTQVSDTALFSNISTRGVVGTGENVMIGGFIIAETGPSKVVVRAVGPSLTKYGVTGVLADPVLNLYDANGNVLFTNDDWQTGQAADITAAGHPLDDPHESGIFATLTPGAYTAIVNGKDGATGVGLVEVYYVP
jgi:hypothetical protein